MKYKKFICSSCKVSFAVDDNDSSRFIACPCCDKVHHVDNKVKVISINKRQKPKGHKPPKKFYALGFAISSVLALAGAIMVVYYTNSLVGSLIGVFLLLWSQNMDSYIEKYRGQ
jgi:PHP family Zn ribbon phosphoesterase